MFDGRYVFEGETIVRCSKCGVVHTVSFSGMNPNTIEQAIEEAMEIDGWGVASMTCPDCHNPIEEQHMRDQEIEDALNLDEFEDYEEDYYEGDEE